MKETFKYVSLTAKKPRKRNPEKIEIQVSGPDDLELISKYIEDNKLKEVTKAIYLEYSGESISSVDADGKPLEIVMRNLFPKLSKELSLESIKIKGGSQ